MRIHTGEKPHPCKECNQTFSRSGHLNSHMRTHTGEKPHSCKECDQTFSESCGLKNHIRIHTGEKPYPCKMCNLTFSQSGHQKRHMRIHVGKKSYCCKECDQTFSQSGHLKSHMRIHSGEKPHCCNECDQTFSQNWTPEESHEDPLWGPTISMQGMWPTFFLNQATWRDTWGSTHQRNHIYARNVSKHFVNMANWKITWWSTKRRSHIHARNVAKHFLDLTTWRVTWWATLEWKWSNIFSNWTPEKTHWDLWLSSTGGSPVFITWPCFRNKTKLIVSRCLESWPLLACFVNHGVPALQPCEPWLRPPTDDIGIHTWISA